MDPRAICREFGFSEIIESKIVKDGFVAHHAAGWRVAYAPEAWIIYGRSRRNGASEGRGPAELRAAMQRNRVLFSDTPPPALEVRR